jgi:hypothetical protein
MSSNELHESHIAEGIILRGTSAGDVDTADSDISARHR